MYCIISLVIKASLPARTVIFPILAGNSPDIFPYDEEKGPIRLQALIDAFQNAITREGTSS